MLKAIIRYFAKRHLLTNIIVIGVITAAIFAWNKTGKEAMPNISYDIVRITTTLKNATPADVEYFITEPIEESLSGISGIKSITSTSGSAQSIITVELEDNKAERGNIVNEIRSAVLETDLPDDIDTPRVREIKTSERSVIDVALIDKNLRILDQKGRENLQKYADTLKDRIERIDLVREVNMSGYLEREIHILLYPDKLLFYNLAITDIIEVLQANNLRQPAGIIKNKEEIRVTILSELDTEEKIRNLIVKGTFEGVTVKLEDVGTVQEGFEDYTAIIKYNGYEGIRLNVVKKASAGIIKTNDLILEEIEAFKNSSLKDSLIDTVIMDDESISIRDRLALISSNGLMGFILVIIILFIFLDFRSGCWVALGIPFCFCFTIAAAYLAGYTINNMTLAAIILVMGMVVDNAIVVSENVGRLRHNGMEAEQAVIEGTEYVLSPIIASVLTTCAAFIPLFFFSGRTGKSVAFIPLLIFLMLGASLFESIFILPSHLYIKFPTLIERKNKREKGHWFEKVEDVYGKLLNKILKAGWLFYIIMVLLLVISLKIYKDHMSFALFPREEVTSVNVEGTAPKGTDKYDTSILTQQVEAIFLPYLGKEVIAFRTDIARSRRGAAALENVFNINIQLVTKDKRNKSSAQLTREWEEQFKNITGLDRLRIVQGWFGQSSGSPIEVIVFENNDSIRNELALKLAEEIRKIPGIALSEVQENKIYSEYTIEYDKQKLQRLSIGVSNVTRTLRAILNSFEVYTLKRDASIEVEVNVSVPDKYKDDIKKVTEIPVKNSGSYLVSLGDIITYKLIQSPDTIQREDFSRTIKVYADIASGYKMTPAEAGNIIEKDIFPQLLAKYPSSNLKFGGEIKDTRESGNDLLYSAIAVIFIIYIILVLLLNSLFKPFIIMISIPFGIVGVILALYFHGISVYGFFSAVGVLGLAGVVINDAIVMLVKLERDYEKTEGKTISERVSEISKTRLRAVTITTVTTVAGLIPTAYGFAGYDSMLSDMMLVMAWGLIFGTLITLILIPMLYCTMIKIKNLTESLRRKK